MKQKKILKNWMVLFWQNHLFVLVGAFDKILSALCSLSDGCSKYVFSYNNKIIKQPKKLKTTKRNKLFSKLYDKWKSKKFSLSAPCHLAICISRYCWGNDDYSSTVKPKIEKKFTSKPSFPPLLLPFTPRWRFLSSL